MKESLYENLINFFTNFIDFDYNEEEIKENHPEFEDANDFEEIFSPWKSIKIPTMNYFLSS